MIFNFSKKINKPIRAFTLIETIVSIFIITIVVLGPLTVASDASSYARQTKDTMVATYLAQEAIELLRHQEDSVYLGCLSESYTACTPILIPSSTTIETQSEAAWRVFRDRLTNNPVVSNGGASCYAATGCAYDFIDMTGDQSINPNKYDPTGGSCNTLSVSPSPENFYVCSGVHGSSSGYIGTQFSRKVVISSVSNITGADSMYNTDLRVAVTVSFKSATGFQRQLTVIDFLHARP